MSEARGDPEAIFRGADGVSAAEARKAEDACSDDTRVG